MSGEQSAQEIYDALRKLRDDPYGPARSARTEELVETADQLGDDEALAAALLALVDAYEYGSESPKVPVVFARALKLYDANPAAFDDNEVHRLYWYFKWVTTALISVPEVPLDTIRAWTEQIRTRYRAAGHRLHAVYAARYAIAWHTGLDLDGAYEAWSTRPRDTFSDCEACEARRRGRYWAARGDDARALAEWAPALEGNPACSEEPAATIAEALLPLVRTGRFDEAASFHRSGYRLTRAKISATVEVGRHLEFAALTGNTPRAIELLAENRGRFDAALGPATALDFLTGVRVLLTRLAADGAGEIPVPGPPGTTHTVTSLLAWVTEQTDSITARFDARNGTSHLGDTHRARYAQLPLLAEPLPLGLRSVLPGISGVPVAAAGPAPAARQPVPEDFPALLAKAREASLVGRPDGDDLWDAVAERVAEADLDYLLRGELAARHAFTAIRQKDWATVREQFDAARDQFLAAGEPGRAASALARAAWSSGMATKGESVPWDELDRALAEADALLADRRITPDQYTTVLQCRAIAMSIPFFGRSAGAPEPTAEQRERYMGEILAMRGAGLRLGALHRAALGAMMAANALGVDGRIDEAIAELRQAVTLFDQSDRPWLLPAALCQLGGALVQTGVFEEAAGLLRRGLALAAEWPDRDFDPSQALEMLAEACRRSGDNAEAARHYTALAARFDRDGEPLAAAAARSMLGQVLVQADRAADAVAVLESLLGEEAEAQLNPKQRGQVRLDLGRGLNTLGEHSAAAEVYLWLADYIADWEDHSIRTMVLCELTISLAAAGMHDEARAAADRALAAHAIEPRSAMVCDMLRTCAETTFNTRGAASIDEVLNYLRQSDEVNEATAEAEGVYQRWPERAQNAGMRARALANTERYEEALAASEQAVSAWQTGGDPAFSRLAEATRIAAVIEGYRLGRREQARERIVPMIASCHVAGLERQAARLEKLLADLAG
jgi:tetratricopeptide (TPR) repeat protein